ncbi:zinc-binding dehydrogenase [Candidatus Uabimicrobium amorphum]|uniref:Alcohol dehydrogenase n=1 Tax=Uabimicrobium amorphum TaxID=2596890 RepID=A0A5S9F0T1_UABAM|nr:zinc-binding dehydrogenase [Candidatus Uabimicrobium amorphum]BBM81907.1 alcohol dehydrogenase [Candidatus Uabimicrobium amorphum]
MKKLWKIKQAGNINNLALSEEKLLPLADDKIRVATRAVGLNFADIFALVGLYSATPKGSFTPGLEFAGTVTQVGKNVDGYKEGDRVFGVTRFGGYSSVIDSLPQYCYALPDDWSFAEGAAYPAQTLTAWYAIKELANVKPQQNVLIQSAAGGVGYQALQICKSIHARAIGNVSTTEKKEFLAKRGFSDIFVRNPNLFTQQVRELLNGQELHVVLDAIGGKVQQQSYDLLSATGRLIIFGAAEYTPTKRRPNYIKSIWKYLSRPRYDSLQLISDNKSVMGFNLIWLWDEVEVLQPMFSEMQAHDLRPFVGKEFSFTEALNAIDWLKSGKSIGKVVLKVDENDF